MPLYLLARQSPPKKSLYPSLVGPQEEASRQYKLQYHKYKTGFHYWTISSASSELRLNILRPIDSCEMIFTDYANRNVLKLTLKEDKTTYVFSDPNNEAFVASAHYCNKHNEKRIELRSRLDDAKSVTMIVEGDFFNGNLVVTNSRGQFIGLVVSNSVNVVHDQCSINIAPGADSLLVLALVVIADELIQNRD